MTKLQKLQRRLKKIEILKKVEPNNPYNDWDKKIERLEGKIELEEARQQGRAEAIEEIFDKIFDVDMDSCFIYLRFDKDNFNVPFIARKDELKEWLKEQFKEQR